MAGGSFIPELGCEQQAVDDLELAIMKIPRSLGDFFFQVGFLGFEICV